MNEERTWKIFATVVGIVSAITARRVLNQYWSKRKGAKPGNTANDDTAWRDAVLFAAMSGVGVGLARIVADRAAAEVWRTVKGTYPPGIKRGGEQPSTV